MKYKIVYGNRRFEACKKLGWKTIEAKVDGNSSTILKIADISTFENARTNKKGIHLLMQSIRDNGLLEPIGITKNKKFSTTELILNGVENVQRHELSRLEKGKLFDLLKRKHNLSPKEIAARFSLTVQTIDGTMGYFNSIPQKYKESIGQKGKREHAISDLLISAAFGKSRSRKSATKILDVAIKNKWSVDKTRSVSRICTAGVDVNRAIKSKDKYITLKSEVAANKQVLETLQKEYKLNRSELVKGMLNGTIPLSKKLVV